LDWSVKCFPFYFSFEKVSQKPPTKEISYFLPHYFD